jgi:radical SAM superfamily enzyme YgiQ (UPF0313 family)
MEKTNPSRTAGESCSDKKILLALLPFWDPQIPPLGLACIKSFLEQHGYRVTAVDANLELEFRDIYDCYFKILDDNVPESKRGNLYNIGNQVLRNHLMTHLNYDDEEKYIELIEILVLKTFYCNLDKSNIVELNKLMAGFYNKLERYFIDLLEKENPSVLGLSLYGDTLPASIFAARLAKERIPAIKIVVGGGVFADQLAPGAPNLEAFLEKTVDYIDKIIIGEGEQLMLKFLRSELKESQRVFGIKDLDDKNMSLTSLSVPDFSDFDIQKYPHLAHYGARSCPYQCRFCSETVIWGKYRKKRVSRLVEEFRQLSRQYSHQLFLMTDSLLNPIVTPLAKEIIKEKVPVYWDGFLRADKPVCDPGNTFLWRQGGFYRAKLGIESGSPNVLKLMGKQITVGQIEKALTSLAYAGVKTTTFWLFGFPGETEEDFQQTLDLVEKLKDYIYEADCNAFNYYLTGQVNSEEWIKQNKGILLYPRWAKNMLVSQTWVLNCEPSREEAYQRLNRFIRHIDALGIPNPYSLNEIYKADERWKKLHKNAVPSLLSFKNSEVSIEERCRLKRVAVFRNTLEDDDDWL